MTAPVKLALVGTVRFGEVAKEQLLAFWDGIVRKTGLPIQFREQMVGVAPAGDGFVVHTSRGSYRTRSVLLALGRRGTPRKLGVPGEESAKVVYRLVDPEQYRGQAVLVVGGGDSAIEAAVALAGQPGTRVDLSYRSEAFARVKPRNRAELERLRDVGRITVRLSSQVLAIDERRGPGDGTGRTDRSAQRRGHRLRGWRAAHTLAAGDGHLVRDQVRYGLRDVRLEWEPLLHKR